MRCHASVSVVVLFWLNFQVAAMDEALSDKTTLDGQGDFAGPLNDKALSI